MLDAASSQKETLVWTSLSEEAQNLLLQATVPLCILVALPLLKLSPASRQINSLCTPEGCLLDELPPRDVAHKDNGADILEDEDVDLEVRDKSVITCRLC